MADWFTIAMLESERADKLEETAKSLSALNHELINQLSQYHCTQKEEEKLRELEGDGEQI